MILPPDSYPSTLIGWREHEQLTLAGMAAVTLDWVARGIIAAPHDVRIRARKSMQSINIHGRRPGPQV